MKAPLFALLAGILAGRLWLPASAMDGLDFVITLSLCVMVLSAGVDVGGKRHIFRRLADYRFRIFLIPLGTVLGSLIFGTISGILMGLAPNEAAAVSCGFGYYSLSAGLLSELGGAELGALAFVSNIFREVLALLTIPFIARTLGRYAAIAPAGATSMDTTLGVISAATDEEGTVIAMFHGVLLSALVPILVPLVYRLF